MTDFKIIFFKSEHGELVKMKEFHRQAMAIQDLVDDPPDEFFEMLDSFFPLHGWAEIDKDNSFIYVIFAPSRKKIIEGEKKEFADWLNHVRPADFF